MGDLSFSIIIPTRNLNGENVGKFISNIEYPRNKIEVIFVEGNHPAIQRNEGAKVAQGDILCFWDNDCLPSPGYFQEAVRVFVGREDEIGALGGPAIPVVKDGILKKGFSWALRSYFAHYKMCARYFPKGKQRETDEKELIGCNLCVNRMAFLNMDGFRPHLYPNEENEFLNRIKNSLGFKIIYDPKLLVFRELRDDFLIFIKRFYRYGRGRSNQIFCEPLKLNLIYFLPLLLFIYLVLFPFLPLFPYGLALILYFVTGFICSFIPAYKEKNLILFFILPLIFLSMHITYALGMLSGFFKNLLWRSQNSKMEVTREYIKVRKVKGFFDI